MYKIEQWIIKHFPQDKLLHIIAGFVIFATIWFSLRFISEAFGIKDYEVLWRILSGIIVIFLGGAKEIIDRRSNQGTPDWWDFICTSLGGLGALIMTL